MTPLDIDQIADWLDAEQRCEDCFDFHGLHGFLTALFLCSEPLSDEWLSSAIDQPLSDLPDADAEAFSQGCVALYKQIGDELYSDSNLSVTFEPTVDYQDSDMEAWCQGFMEVVFERPEAWQHEDEEQLALLLLPIETASGFFVDEPDFQKLYSQPELLTQMFNDIPELLTDIYLLFHAPS
ncbi:YecA family protein [Reinekea sp.]|jgi:uncharacterized protein|uniref:YecA/YgfB family protein n=1 Tax=Reinekea sp. TaxID=1970455 RepID=UPI002A82E4D8|nr:YecA family protein [Reinekea sp.]